MPSTTDISPLSITDCKISNEAKIAHAKLAKATEGQVLVAQSDGKFAAKTLAGDVTLAADGSTTSNVAVASDGTTVVAGPAGAKGDKGDTGNQGATGATGPAGSDATVTEATVNAAGAVMHTDIPDSDTGFVKRTGAETYDVDTSTYSTTGHTHDHNALTNYDVAEHRVINDGGTSSTELWSANNINYHLGGKAASGHLHTGVYSATGHTHDLSDITDSGTAAPLDVPASGNASSSQVVKGDDTRLSDDRDPTAHKTSHSLGGSDAIAPHDIGASATGHTHDSRYYTETETDTLLAAKSGTGHTHDDRYYTETEADTLLAAKSGTGHTHDSRYFQESEFLNASAGAGDAGKPVKLDADGHIDSSMINSGDVSFVDLDDLPSTFAPSSHTHSTGNNGFVPAAGSSGQFLAHDGTFQTPAGNLDWTTDQGSTNIHAGNYTNTTYTADDGIGLTGTTFSVAAGTGLTQDATGLSLNLQGVTEAAVRADEDYIVFLDGGSTGAAKKESIEDLATAMAGFGIAASNGELAVDIKYARSILWSTTQSNVSYNTGNTIATLTHNLGSLYVTVSVKDVDGVLHNTAASSTGGYLLDLDYDVLIRVVDSNNISIEFDVDTGTMGDIITNQNEFQVTVMG